jgi:hypothetical protein
MSNKPDKEAFDEIATRAFGQKKPGILHHRLRSGRGVVPGLSENNT